MYENSQLNGFCLPLFLPVPALVLKKKQNKEYNFFFTSAMAHQT